VGKHSTQQRRKTRAQIAGGRQGFVEGREKNKTRARVLMEANSSGMLGGADRGQGEDETGAEERGGKGGSGAPVGSDGERSGRKKSWTNDNEDAFKRSIFVEKNSHIIGSGIRSLQERTTVP